MQEEIEDSTTVQQDGKRKRKGGDRAAWYRIRDDDYPTRHLWCVPGGVFGWYADGVGPLLPNEIRPRRSVVVYSTDPDTVEAHPNPDEGDHYVRIVMVCMSLCLCLSLSVSLSISLSLTLSLPLSLSLCLCLPLSISPPLPLVPLIGCLLPVR